MIGSYFLTVWVPKYKCYWPIEIYQSKSYAKKVAKKKGYPNINIKCLDKYDSFHVIKEEIYKVNPEEVEEYGWEKCNYYLEEVIKC